jgi:hypothetical protein
MPFTASIFTKLVISDRYSIEILFFIEFHRISQEMWELTNSTEQGSSWEANSFSGSREISRIL